MDFTKVLWSTYRETDKIYSVRLVDLTVPAGSTNGTSTYFDLGYDTEGLPKDTNGLTFMQGVRAQVFFMPEGSNTWIPASNINGSATMSPTGVSVGYSANMFGGSDIFAFASSTSGSDRNVKVAIILSAVKPQPISVFGFNFQYGCGFRTIYSDATKQKIKWSSFDKQATVAGSLTMSYVSNNTARRLATIPHGQATRPMVKYTVSLFSGTLSEPIAVPIQDYVRIWKDNTNIYVEYEPISPGGVGYDVMLEVWWYHES